MVVEEEKWYEPWQEKAN